MEDSGYMARAAFIMDKIMHKMGLHGKSFIPLIMGFGCNVPAVMATRTIESHRSRLITMLILPLMSCSARKKLRELGFVSEHKHGVPCKVHFRVEHDSLYTALVKYAEKHQSSMWESHKLECGNPSNKDVEKPHTNTENTTEITTEIRRSAAELTQILKGKKPVEALIAIGLEKDVAQRFNEHRKALKKPLTLEGLIKHYHESCNAGISTNDAARIVLSESWIGFANRYNWKPVYESLISESKSAQPEQKSQQAINLPSKPKGFLGGSQ
jgi:hypothetical protein